MSEPGSKNTLLSFAVTFGRETMRIEVAEDVWHGVPRRYGSIGYGEYQKGSATLVYGIPSNEPLTNFVGRVIETAHVLAARRVFTERDLST